METLKKNLANLLKVKTIVTLLLTVVFCILALTGVISGSDFLTVFTVVIAFYFGTQSEKKAAAGYSGPQQGGEPVAELAAPMVENVDAATADKVHPPDGELVVTGFAE